MAGLRRPGVRLLRILGALALAATALAVPVAVAGGGGCHARVEAIATEGTSATVRLDGCTFAPTITRVPVGAEVRFVNVSNTYHDVTGRRYAWGSEQLESGESYAHRFTANGLYPYSCSLHPGMAGVVVVGDGAGSTAGDAAPGGAAGAISDEPPGGHSGTSATASVGALLGGGALVALAGLVGLVLVPRRKASDTPPGPVESRLGAPVTRVLRRQVHARAEQTGTARPAAVYRD